MTRTARLITAGVLALGGLAAGSASASAVVPYVPGACSASVSVPGTAVTFSHCDRVAPPARWAEWVEVRNPGNANTLQAQVKVRVGGSFGPTSAPALLNVPARTIGMWDPLTGRRAVGVPVALRSCTPGSIVQPSVRLRDDPTSTWSAWVPARAFVC